MKKVIIICGISIILILICLILFFNDMQMNECLGIRVPKLTKRETIKLKSGKFFDDERVNKIYLSKIQMKRLLKKVEENENWRNGKLDERLDEKMKKFTRENIYDEIPNIENAYWIFTNRSHGVDDQHSVDEMLNDMYYAISFGIVDIDNNILYYYEYDR